MRRATDGPWYVHTLHNFEAFLDQMKVLSIVAKADAGDFESWTAIQSKIEQRFNEAVDVPRHFEKVQWFAKYWNDISHNYPGPYVMRINGPGLDYPPARWA